ncbi:MAG: flippase-like domain-containing protein [Deltaproteobacteria bacterium]|nr:flippase-like domain-containing protein [Deltaproteobacteria bacterium]
MPSKSKIKSIISQILKASVAVGLLLYLGLTGKMDVVKIAHALVASPWMLLAIGLEFLAMWMIGIRWHLLLYSQGVRLSLLKTMKFVFIGHFFNVVIPGTVSGDVVKAYYVIRGHSNKMVAGLSVFMDRFIGLIVLLLVTCLAVGFNGAFVQSIPELTILAMITWMGFIFLIVFGIVFILKKDMKLPLYFPAFFRNLTEAFWSYRNDFKSLWKASLLTLINFFINLLVYYSAMKALEIELLPFTQYLFIIPIGMFAMALPLAPAGLGIGQGVFLKLFEWAYHKPLTAGADMISLVQIAYISWALVGCIVYLLHKEDVSLKEMEREVLST